MKTMLLLISFGGLAFFVTPTELAPKENTSNIVAMIATASEVDSCFVLAVMSTTCPNPVPETNDLFGTGESYTSTASATANFCRWLHTQKIPKNILKSNPVVITQLLGRSGVLKDTSNLLDKLQCQNP